jgi:hypothetical protein
MNCYCSNTGLIPRSIHSEILNKVTIFEAALSSLRTKEDQSKDSSGVAGYGL